MSKTCVYSPSAICFVPFSSNSSYSQCVSDPSPFSCAPDTVESTPSPWNNWFFLLFEGTDFSREVVFVILHNVIKKKNMKPSLPISASLLHPYLFLNIDPCVQIFGCFWPFLKIFENFVTIMSQLNSNSHTLTQPW